MLFIIWYCVDDHLAAALGNPGVGQIDWWVILLLSFVVGNVKVSSGSKG